jgi:hypothetical protein
MSQVAWRRKEFLEANIKFPFPMTANLDAVIFNQMHNNFGDCKFSGFIGEYKGMYKYSIRILTRPVKADGSSDNTRTDFYKNYPITFTL